MIGLLASGKVNELVGHSLENTDLDQPTKAFISMGVAVALGVVSLTSYRSGERNFNNATELKFMADGLRNEVTPSAN